MYACSRPEIFVNQAALTGESMPVEKIPAVVTVSGDNQNPLEMQNVCFMGSNVESGTGMAVVIQTGSETYFGSLAGSIVGQRQLTSFDKGVNGFTWLMIGFMIVMVPLVFLFNGLSKGNWLEAFLFALAVAVGLTPEMLPMIVTVKFVEGRDFDVEEKSDRQASEFDPELWRNGCALYRQDRHDHRRPDCP